MITLNTNEEKELWKQVFVAYVNGRNGAAVHGYATDVADRAVQHLRDRDKTNNQERV